MSKAREFGFYLAELATRRPRQTRYIRWTLAAVLVALPFVLAAYQIMHGKGFKLAGFLLFGLVMAGKVYRDDRRRKRRGLV
jgi:hypothetical protein